MKLNSFRLKIALLSALVSGGLLLVAGAVLWERTYQVELARIDRELRNLGTPHLERVVGGDHWVRFENALRFVAGSNAAPTFILWVRIDDRVVYQSPHWPTEMPAESFPVLTAYETPEGPKPGQPLPPPPRRGEEISPRNPALPRKAPQFVTRRAVGKNWRIGVMGNPYVTLILGTDINEFNVGMAQLRRAYFATLPAALLLVAAGAWFIASRALRPVTSLTQTAERITARGLDQRIPAFAHDQEFNRLVTVFNEMMDRLEKSFQQAVRFSADASHELKTPLALLQVELEQALENAPSGSPQQVVYSSLLDDIHRLKATVDKLLLLSLADGGRLRLDLQPLNLSEQVANVLEDAEILAGGLILEQEIAEDVQVVADLDLLRQVLQNLLSNAIKYNRPGGRIRFELALEANRVVLRMGNTGPGIPDADRARVFERFFRVDRSRSHRVDGVGLGLNLSREIIRAHGGEIRLLPSEVDWTCFEIEWPKPPV